MKAPFDCAAEKQAGKEVLGLMHVASNVMNSWCFQAGRMLILKTFRGLFFTFSVGLCREVQQDFPPLPPLIYWTTNHFKDLLALILVPG